MVEFQFIQKNDYAFKIHCIYPEVFLTECVTMLMLCSNHIENLMHYRVLCVIDNIAVLLMGYFIGHRQYVRSDREVRSAQEQLAHQRRLAKESWDSQWITIWRLKRFRLWTDKAIAMWLGKPKTKGKYKVFSVDDVRRAERTPAFKEWIGPRLARKLLSDEYFKVSKL